MVMADAGGDDDKLTLAQQLFGRTAAILGRHPPESNTNDISEAKATSAVERHFPVIESSPPTAPHLEASEGEASQKQIKTAAELAEMIEQDLVALHSDFDGLGRAFRLARAGVSDQRGPRCCEASLVAL
jgi:hypothetical protein